GRDEPADQPGDHAFHQERQLDVEVGRADQPHDAGLPAPVERGQPDRVRHQQCRGDDQDDRDDYHRVPRPVEQLVEVAQDGPVVHDVVYAGVPLHRAGYHVEVGGRVLELHLE